jgi:hypothetical protein
VTLKMKEVLPGRIAAKSIFCPGNVRTYFNRQMGFPQVRYWPTPILSPPFLKGDYQATRKIPPLTSVVSGKVFAVPPLGKKGKMWPQALACAAKRHKLHAWQCPPHKSLQAWIRHIFYRTALPLPLLPKRGKKTAPESNLVDELLSKVFHRV